MAKLYGWLAGLVAVLAVIGVIYGKGRLDANHAAEVAQLKRDLKTYEVIMKAERDARIQDAILANEAAKRQTSLKLKITGLNDYVDTLQDANRECFSGTDVERLRDLWDR